MLLAPLAPLLGLRRDVFRALLGRLRRATPSFDGLLQYSATLSTEGVGDSKAVRRRIWVTLMVNIHEMDKSCKSSDGPRCRDGGAAGLLGRQDSASCAWPASAVAAPAGGGHSTVAPLTTVVLVLPVEFDALERFTIERPTGGRSGIGVGHGEDYRRAPSRGPRSRMWGRFGYQWIDGPDPLRCSVRLARIRNGHHRSRQVSAALPGRDGNGRRALARGW